MNDPLQEAIDSLGSTMAFDPRDWSKDRRDAWLYEVIVGWGEAIDVVCKLHKWDEKTKARLRMLSAAVQEARRQTDAF